MFTSAICDDGSLIGSSYWTQRSRWKLWRREKKNHKTIVFLDDFWDQTVTAFWYFIFEDLKEGLSIQRHELWETRELRSIFYSKCCNIRRSWRLMNKVTGIPNFPYIWLRFILVNNSTKEEEIIHFQNCWKDYFNPYGKSTRRYQRTRIESCVP